jgi:hypothetical protein
MKTEEQSYKNFNELTLRGQSICEIFNCPHGKYQAGMGKIYGCQKYPTAGHCILSQVKNTQDNQYLVYVKDKENLCPNQMVVMKLAVENVPLDAKDLALLEAEHVELTTQFYQAKDRETRLTAQARRKEIADKIDRIETQFFNL